MRIDTNDSIDLIDSKEREASSPAGPQSSEEHERSRREFLTMAIAGGAAGLAAQLTLADPPVAFAQSALSPQTALDQLVAGNKRFAAGKLTAHEQDVAILRQHNLEKQEPFAGVLTCSDSRVPVEMVFDQSIGHIFVARVAGNVVTPEIIGSLEYGAVVLGTKVIVVMGHGACGAVKAAIAGKPVPGQISSLFPHIQPAVEQAGSNVEAAIKANAKIQASLLAEGSPLLSEMVKEKKLKIVAAYYDMGSGVVTLL